MKLTPLTDEELRIHQIPEAFHEFAYWDEEGYLITIHCHQGAIDQLKATTTNDSQKETTDQNRIDQARPIPQKGQGGSGHV